MLRKENYNNTICYRKRKVKRMNIENMNQEEKKNYFQSQSKTISRLLPSSTVFVSPLLQNDDTNGNKLDNESESEYDDDDDDDNDEDDEGKNNVANITVDKIVDNADNNDDNQIDTIDAVLKIKKANKNRTSVSSNFQDDDNEDDDQVLIDMKEKLIRLRKELKDQHEVYQAVQYEKETLTKRVKYLDSW